jgi:hypothetical protein
MITFQKLGEHGRLGNQMFQYALLEGIKDRTGYNIIFSEGKESIDLFKYFDISGCHFYNPNDVNVKHNFIEEYFHFNRKIITCLDNTNFDGYFQSSRYFDHCKETIIKQFSFKNEYLESAKSFLLPYHDKTLVSVHVRRTDYLNLQNHHPVLTLDYYTKAFDYFKDTPNVLFIVTSDDIEWCKENFAQDNIVFSNNPHPTDMCITSLCHHNIIANSSFSWWGSYLNTNINKIIIAPTIWFGPSYFHFDTKDLYCDNFIKM